MNEQRRGRGCDLKRLQQAQEQHTLHPKQDIAAIPKSQEEMTEAKEEERRRTHQKKRKQNQRTRTRTNK